MPLTAKQEKFARLIAIEGLDQSKAYRAAYSVSPATLPASVWREASALAANLEVASRIDALKADAALAEESRLAELTDRITAKLEAIGLAEIPHGRIRAADQIAALDKLAKLLGLYPVVPALSGLVVSGRVDHVFRSWTDEELRALVAARPTIKALAAPAVAESAGVVPLNPSADAAETSPEAGTVSELT